MEIIKVFYRLYLNTRAFEDENEHRHMIIYAFKKDGCAKQNQVDFTFKRKFKNQQDEIIELIKENSKELKNDTITLQFTESETINPLFYACLQS